MGTARNQVIQIGQESTAAKGTEVNADIIWLGNGRIIDNLSLVFPNENVNRSSPVNRSYISHYEAALEMDPTEATYEQLPHIFEASIEKATATQDGAGSGYIYVYDPLTTSSVSYIATYTIEYSDSEQEEQFTYGFVTDFNISGNATEAVMVSANWLGRQVATGTLTGALTLSTVEEIPFGKGKLYIDGTSDTFGTTQVTNAWLGFSLDYNSGIQPVPTGDGNTYFTYEKYTGAEVMVDLTFEHETGAINEKAAWRAETTRMVRMEFTGSTLATSGTTYANKMFIVDVAGKWESFDKLAEQDGNTIVTGRFRGAYDPTCDDFCRFTVVNALTALP